MKNKESSRIMKSIDGYIKGNLSPDEVDRLWEMMLEHPEYYPVLRTEAALKKKVLNEKTEEKKNLYTAYRYHKKSNWVYALAAAMLLSLFIGLFRFYSAADEITNIDEIAVINLIAPDIIRSSAGPASEPEREFHSAYMLAIAGETENAISVYRSLLNEEISRDTINYNLAILYYNSGNYTASASTFEQINCSAFSEPQRIESCLWFKTNSYLAIRDTEMALQAAAQVKAMGRQYSDQASAILYALESGH